MTRFRFVHAADLHLDTPFEGVGKVAPEVAGRLRDASLEAFDNLVEFTMQSGAAFLILAGDVYDGAVRGVRAQLRFFRGVERLAERHIPVFVVHGNHDPLGGWSAARDIPSNLHVFGSAAVEARVVTKGGSDLATIYGISYARAEMAENLALRYERQDSAGPHIAMLHCSAGTFAGHEAYSACSIDDLTRAKMDYWALGHIHQHLYLAEGRPWIVYPGSLQARSAKSSEHGAKGAILVEVADGAIENVRFEALDRIRYAAIAIDISATADFVALQKAIGVEADELRTACDGRDALATVTLTGRGPLHYDLRREGTAAEVLRDVRESLSDMTPFVWVDRLIDRTKGTLDRAAIESRGDFSSDLTRVTRQLLSDPDALSVFYDQQAAPLERPSVRKWLAEVPSGDVAELLSSAEEFAL
ncbi:MAG: DNA repair exonuclease, partial [Bryobacteraceae bacterium]